jgi:hypothetical protein
MKAGSFLNCLYINGNEVMIIGLVLESTSTSLLIEERRITDIVIGVPHHAPAGVEKLPCGRVSDENAGFLGRYIAEKLDCCSIIACNYTMDVNKCSGRDYAVQIAKWQPKVLVEIHGHGGKKAKYHIEISSGSKEENKEYSMPLAKKLSDKHLKDDQQKEISICGDYGKIYFKAKDTATIRDGRWRAFHIELPPKLRIPGDDKRGKPPRLGYQFCDCLVEVLKEMYPHAC